MVLLFGANNVTRDGQQASMNSHYFAVFKCIEDTSLYVNLEGFCKALGYVSNGNSMYTIVKSLGGIMANWQISDALRAKYPAQSAFIDQILPYAEKIWNETGIPWQVLIAQTCMESGYGSSEIKDMYTGERSYNLFGIKAVGSTPYVTATTKEDDGTGKLVNTIAKFAKYDNFQHAFDGYRDTLLNKNFIHALRSKNDPIEYVKDIQSQLPGESHAKYATDTNYVTTMEAIMKMWG